MGRKERSEDLVQQTPSCHVLTMRHLSDYTGHVLALSTHQALTQHSSTLSPVPLGALNNWEVQTFLSRTAILEAWKTNCDVESYRYHKSLFSGLWVWSSLSTSLPSPWPQQCSLQARARDPMAEVQNFSAFKVTSSPHSDNLYPFC